MGEEIREKIRNYAPYIIEFVRSKLGYSENDTTHDDEVIKYLESGQKLSKSIHMV